MLLLAGCLCLLMRGGVVLGQDVVELGRGPSGGTQTIRGTIISLNQQQLRMRSSTGREITYPADRVLQVQTSYTEEHQEADRLFEQHRYAAALQKYSELLKSRQERRDWVRQQIVARQVRCAVFLRRPQLAATYFFALYQNDPLTRHLDCIPLAWTSSEVDVFFQRAALEWLKPRRPAVEQLIAASHLLGMADQRAIARQRLAVLAQDKEGESSQLPWLAQVQLWRLDLATATAQQWSQREEQVNQRPPEVQAGAWLVIGQGWARNSQPERAALCWLRVPILHPEDRSLAVKALLNAARALETAGQSSSAVRLYAEVARDYPEFQAEAAAAQKRLAMLSPGDPQSSEDNSATR